MYDGGDDNAAIHNYTEERAPILPPYPPHHHKTSVAPYFKVQYINNDRPSIIISNRLYSIIKEVLNDARGIITYFIS